jgi:hypothetical protein
MINAHILHGKKRKIIPLVLIYEMVAEGLFTCVEQDVQEWTRSTSADALTDTIFHTEFQQHSLSERTVSAILQVCGHW